MDDTSQGDICRVCRSEGASDKPLFHPCICTGSIKFIHQDCLVQWLRYSEKDFCELCNHKFSFIPIYSPDMPKRLPFRDILHGLFGSLATAVRFWFHYTLVAVAWLGIVPLTAYRIYRCLFSGSFTSIITLPLDILSTENLVSDGFYGCCVVTCTLCAFICLVWLREQILRGGGPEWLDQQQEENVAPVVVEPEPEEGAPGINENNNINNNNNGELDPDGDVIMEEEAPAVAEDVAQVNEPLENLEPNENNALVAQDDINWNPVEWDRGADELTWERILGLDGSLVFLEHVFWVISLNTLFIIIFAYVPFHIGCFLLVKSDLYSMVEATQFEGLVTTLCGYLVIGTGLVLLHACTSLMSFKRTERLLGLCYVVVKVSLLSVFEIGVFPLICGWWLDICSLPLLGATLEEREASFATAPGTSMFIHWLAGMVYVFYFASFILLLREVLRPGVLWFLQNLNDPEFNPIQEMIHLPIFGHLRRFLASLVIFGTTVLLMMWFPVRIVQKLMPGFLPYNVSLSNGNGSESPTSELSLEFLLLQLVLPALLDHGHLRQWLKSLIKGWCIVMSSVLNIRSYLLGDVPIPNEEEDVVQPVNQATNQPYKCPTVLTFRIISLLVLTGLSLLASGLFLITVPVSIGRSLIGLWMGNVKVHELNTAACGLYVGLLATRFVTLLCRWIPRGWNVIANKLKEGLLIAAKASIAGTILLGVIPLMIGLLFDLVFIVPLRVPQHQTPIFYLWQDWAFGVLHTKVICGIALMADWQLRHDLVEVYENGLLNMDLKLILQKFAIPAILVLGHLIAVPYVFVHTLAYWNGYSDMELATVLRKTYPLMLFLGGGTILCRWQINKFRKLYEHIKNDKYLVGKRLVNYNPARRDTSLRPTSTAVVPQLQH